MGTEKSVKPKKISKHLNWNETTQNVWFYFSFAVCLRIYAKWKQNKVIVIHIFRISIFYWIRCDLQYVKQLKQYFTEMNERLNNTWEMCRQICTTFSQSIFCSLSLSFLSAPFSLATWAVQQLNEVDGTHLWWHSKFVAICHFTPKKIKTLTHIYIYNLHLTYCVVFCGCSSFYLPHTQMCSIWKSIFSIFYCRVFGFYEWNEKKKKQKLWKSSSYFRIQPRKEITGSL